MRKFMLAAVGLFFTVGLALAAEVTFVKFDKEKKELTVKGDDDKESTYKITDDTKFKMKGKDGDVDVPAEKALDRLEKAKEGKTKFDIEVDKDKKAVKELTFRGRGKKK